MIFTKMHGLGNDYVCINCFRERVEDPPGFARTLCDRHYGIGADGLILICPSKVSDFKMEIYNSDGSVAGMCGNGIRCLGKYVYDHRLTGKETLSIETKSGIRNMHLHIQDGKACGAMVDMGVPRLNAHSIPILSEKDLVINDPIEVQKKNYRMTGISMGNPHAVIPVEDVEKISIAKTGSAFEHLSCFPDRINTEFIQTLDQHTIKMRVWERGSGETLSCGTGACAAAVAAMLSGCVSEGETAVELRGGRLFVTWDRTKNKVLLTGPAETVFEGTLAERI